MNTMPELLTKQETIERNLILNRNALMQAEIDERFLQRMVLRDPKVAPELSQLQGKVKHIKSVIDFLEEIRLEVVK